MERSMTMNPQVTPEVFIDDTEAALLTDLLDLNRDNQNGYQTAAAALHNTDYAALFAQYAQERQANADELKRLLNANGRTPDRVGTLSGLLHQGWLNLESLLTTGDASIFAECERLDELTLAAYQDVMGQTTREELMSILRRQFTVIRDAHDRVKVLRGALEQAQK